MTLQDTELPDLRQQFGSTRQQFGNITLTIFFEVSKNRKLIMNKIISREIQKYFLRIILLKIYWQRCCRRCRTFSSPALLDE